MEDFLKNHPFPDLTSFLPSEEEVNRSEVANWARRTPINTSSILPPVDLNEVFENVVEKRIDSSQMFNYQFDFDENTGHIKGVDVKINTCENTKCFEDSSQDLFTVDDKFVKEKLPFLDDLETFEEFECQVDDLPLPQGELESFVLKELPIKREDQQQNDDAGDTSSTKSATTKPPKTPLPGFTPAIKEISEFCQNFPQTLKKT